MKTSCPGHVWTGQVWTDLLFSLFISFENAHHADRIVKILEAAVDLHIAESFLQCVHRQVRAEADLIQKFYQDLVHGIQTVCTAVDSRHQRMITPMNVGLKDVTPARDRICNKRRLPLSLCFRARISFPRLHLTWFANQPRLVIHVSFARHNRRVSESRHPFSQSRCTLILKEQTIDFQL